MFRTRLGFVALSLSLAVSALSHAATVVDDRFNDGGSTNGADAQDVNYLKAVGGAFNVNAASANLTGNSLYFVPGDSFRPIVASFTPTTLGAAGSATATIRLQFDFEVFGSNSIGSGATQNGSGSPADSDFRYGLFNTAGTLPTADDDTKSANDFGYRANIPVGTGSTANMTTVQEIGTVPEILSGADAGTLNSLTTSGLTRVAGGVGRSAVLSITNTGSGVEIRSSVFDGLGATGTELASVTATDGGSLRGTATANAETGTNQYYTTFDEIGFSSGGQNYNFRLDNLTVSTVPEPGMALVSLATLGLLALRKRRHKVAR